MFQVDNSRPTFILRRCEILARLTSLTLSGIGLLDNFEVPLGLSSLRELGLHLMTVDESFFRNLPTLLSLLTKLSLIGCNLVTWDPQVLQAPSSLRWAVSEYREVTTHEMLHKGYFACLIHSYPL